MNTKPRLNPWPVSIIAFFVIAAIFLTTFIAWSLRQREDLVSSDYYEKEVRYQQRLDSMNRSLPMAAQPLVTFEPDKQNIVIALPADRIQNAKGTVHLYRPSDARLDCELPLGLGIDGTQRFDTRKMSDGLWKVRIEWNSGGQDYFLEQPVVITSG